MGMNELENGNIEEAVDCFKVVAEELEEAGIKYTGTPEGCDLGWQS